MRSAPAVILGKLRMGVTQPLRVACVALPALLLLGLAWIDYRVELARIRTDVVTTADALAEHARTVAETVDLVTARVLDHIDRQDWATLATSLETHEFLDRLRRELPQVEAVYLIAPNGMLAASSRGYPMPHHDVHDAGYFAAVQAHDDDRIVISEPFPGTISGTTGFMISRRRVVNGRFDGVVGVTVSRRYFEDFYRAILDRPDASAAALLRSDGALLIGFPDPRGALAASPNPMKAVVVAARDSGVFNSQSGFDGRQQIIAYRRVRDQPLLAVYAIDRSVLLTTWAWHAVVIAVCAILLSGLLLTAEHLVRRKTAIEHEGLRRLVEETERRRQAEARAQQGQKMEALGRLTGGVAHDFNNLLAVILGSLELVLRREQDPRSVRLLRSATKAAERGAKLTAQMLTFSRRHEVVVRPVDVNAVLQDMDDLLRRTLGPSVLLHYALAGDLWPALADPVQLELALLNLTVNARDAMPHGGDLTIRTFAVADGDRTAPVQESGDFVCVQVVDTGIGMSEEVRARAHEPFFTTKAPGSGTGLGLSMVNGFVSEIGGALSFDSAPGVGTTVSVFLRRSSVAPANEQRDQDPQAPSVHPRRLLLVDDDPSVRASIRAMLEELEHEVIEAAGGVEALQVLERDRRFDLLVIDFAMPSMNGAQLAAEVMRLWPMAPILFVTGYVENDALRPWSDLGYRTVQKPFTTAELATAVERAIWAPAPESAATSGMTAVGIPASLS
jgi:two-component system NtrC family sensor kinase